MLHNGAKLLFGGKRLEIRNFEEGYFFMPTVVELTNTDNPLFKEEVFGPVFALFKSKNEKEMIELANNTEFGLGAVIVTSG